MAELMEMTHAKDMDGQPIPVDVERYGVSNFTIFATNYEVGIICSGTTPAYDESGKVGIAMIPKAFLSIPPLAAKELMVLLQRFVSDHETEFGELKSDFLAKNQA